MESEKEYCMYLRKSRRDEKFDSAIGDKSCEELTLERHKKILFELAERLNIHIYEKNIFAEVHSGERIEDRPAIKQLIAQIEKGTVAGVMVVAIDRLTRGDGEDQAIIQKVFKHNHVKIITLAQTFDLNNNNDFDFLDMLMFMGHSEYKTIKYRLSLGRELASREGKFVGSVAPYGYKAVQLQNGSGFTLEVIPEEADIVKLIYNLYMKGGIQEDGAYKQLGTSLITKKLNELGIKPRVNDYWTVPSVREILKNPAYKGYIRWNSRKRVNRTKNGIQYTTRPRNIQDSIEVKGLHSAIIDEDLWDEAQKIMKNKVINPIPKNKEIKNPLAGLVRCSVCNHLMTRRPYTNGQEDTLMCPIPGCSNVSSKLAMVEKRVIEEIKNITKEYKINIKESNFEENNNSLMTNIFSKKISDINKEIEKLEKRRKNILNRIDDEEYTEIYTKDLTYTRLKEVNDEINELNNQLQKIEKDMELELKKRNNLEVIIPQIESVVDIYHSLSSVKAKNDVLKELIEVVYYQKTENTRWTGSEENFKLKIVTKLLEE